MGKHSKIHFLAIFIFVTSFSYSQNVALNLDGTDDHVVIKDTSIINPTKAITVEAWINASSYGKNHYDNSIFCKHGWASGNVGYVLRCGDNGKLSFVLSDGTTTWKGPVSTSIMKTGQWYHVAATFDGDTIIIFVNGKREGITLYSGAITPSKGLNAKIGALAYTSGRNFNGTIDEVRVYNIARKDSVIQAEMNKEFCSNPSNLVAYYKLNEGASNSTNTGKNSAKDYSIYRRNGTLTNFSLSGSTSNWTTGPKLSSGNTYSTIDTTVCNKYISPKGKVHTKSGIFSETISNKQGCDSVITIKLKLGPTYGLIKMSGCDSVISQTGKIWRKTGNYFDTLTNRNSLGCDSILVANVSIDSVKYGRDTFTSCDSLKVKSKWYYTSQEVTYKEVSSMGCDSFHTTSVNIVNASSQIFPVTACIGYKLVNGEVVNGAGLYYDTMINYMGCDSILIYNVSLRGDFTAVVDTTVCDSFISPSLKVYRNSGSFNETYSGRWSCDSVVTYNVIVHISKTFPVEMTVCDSFLSDGGVTYKKSGIYTESNSSFQGCDSIIEYKLTILRPKEFAYNSKKCDSAQIDGRWYFTSQLVENTKKSYLGCDSIVKVSLTVVNIDNSVSQNKQVLTANMSGVNYKWKNCTTNKIITGETNQSFEAKSNGSYAVIIEDNGCEKTSICHTVNTLGLEEASAMRATIFPNPNNGNFYVSISSLQRIKTVEIYDLQGKLWLTQIGDNKHYYTLKSAMPVGIYLVKINSNKGIYYNKILVK